MIPPRPAILIGAGGHARVVASLARACGLMLHGVCDPALSAGGTADWEGMPVLGDDTALSAYPPGSFVLLNGLGHMPRKTHRQMVAQRLGALGYDFPALVHPVAWVAPGTSLGAGVQVMAGAVVQPGCRIGAGSIINTRASVDHDGWIGADVHIAPGATLCGGVTVGDGAFVGAGATVVQGVEIACGAIVAAGAVVMQAVAAGETCFGRGQKRNM